MDSELDKIDILRNRLQVSYEDARRALTATSGDVVGALAALEKECSERKDILALGAEIADEVQKLAAGGPFRRLRVKYGNRLITEQPLALKAAAAVAVGLAAVIISRLVIEVDSGEEGTAA